jgi:mRNA-degrading endonuclease RelE of RelBE toxin-antitoxin system
LPYRLVILEPAKRSFKKLEKHERNIARALVRSLKNDPRPAGHDQVAGYSPLLRVKKDNMRVIYGVHNDVIVIIEVRKRNEGTYKNLPIETYSQFIRGLLDKLR